MTWVIAILLGLILVAMVSSNQAAAAGVWTVVRFVLWGIAALAGWGVLVGYSVLFYATYPPSSEWTQIIGIACTVIIPPILLWLSRKTIATAYKKNKWAAVRYGALIVAYIFVVMLTSIVVREVQAAYEYGGWLMILVPLAFTGSDCCGDRSMAPKVGVRSGLAHRMNPNRGLSLCKSGTHLVHLKKQFGKKLQKLGIS